MNDIHPKAFLDVCEAIKRHNDILMFLIEADNFRQFSGDGINNVKDDLLRIHMKFSGGLDANIYKEDSSETQ